jgi:hypothetical protein
VSKHAGFSVIWTHLSRGLASNARQSNTSRGRWIGRRTLFRDQPQDGSEQMLGDGDPGHLEGEVAAVADDLRADLDGFLVQDVLERLAYRANFCASVCPSSAL